MAEVEQPATLAALDLGTNSFHLVVARLRGDRYEVITREKETIRLGHGGGDMKHLEPGAMDRGIAALARMKRIADAHGATVRAVATSAVREAENNDEFLRRACDEAGVSIEIISGLEEARLIHLGVLQSVPAFERRMLAIDIGGGSTEVLVGQRGEMLTARSFKLGAVRLTDRFFPGGATSPKSVKACRSYVASVIGGFGKEVARHGFDLTVVSSGTAETVALLVNAARREPTPRSFNLFEFSRDELDQVTERLAAKRTSAARSTVGGLDLARADIIVAGAIVMQQMARAFGVDRFTFSDSALREGVLLDTISRTVGGELHHLRDVSRRSVQTLGDRCDDDPKHSAHVARLALQIFDTTQDQHRLPAHARDYLEAAALLANVGLVISHSKHHLHSYYVIRNSELAGLTDNEIEIIALIARYHRKSAPKASHPEFERLGPADREMVRALSAMLRVAIGLDRRHEGNVTAVRARSRKGRIVLQLLPRDGADIELECYTAGERSGLLAEVLGAPIELTAVAG